MAYSNGYSGPVELEAPTVLQNIQGVLRDAASADQARIQHATKQLQKWEKENDYYSHLMTIFTSSNVPSEVRYLVAIQLKNGTAKYWRKSSANVITDQEKTYIRSVCLDAGIHEHDHRLVLQIALMVAKIIRFDYPRDW